MALSAKRKAARLFVLNHAAAWLDDIEATEVADDSEFDEELVIEESKKLAERLSNAAIKLKNT